MAAHVRTCIAETETERRNIRGARVFIQGCGKLPLFVAASVELMWGGQFSEQHIVQSQHRPVSIEGHRKPSTSNRLHRLYHLVSMMMAAALYYVARFSVALAVPLILSAFAPRSTSSPVHQDPRGKGDKPSHIQDTRREVQRTPIKLSIGKGARKVVFSRRSEDE